MTVTNSRDRKSEARLWEVASGKRLGHLEVGDVSVAVAVSCPHRAQAFEACRYAIEEIKRRVPVWKKELRSDGSEVWVDPSGRPTSKPAHV